MHLRVPSPMSVLSAVLFFAHVGFLLKKGLLWADG